MTFAQVMQLYAPLAGLLVVVFWLGVLSQRVKSLEEDVKDLKSDGGKDGSSERIVRLEVKMDGVGEQLASINRNMAGVQRQLANIATGQGLPHGAA